MEADFVERTCLLLEAGDYPDKGVTITPDDLQAIASNSPGEIPVKIEHLASSPFDGALGVVTQLRAAGSQLWGTLRQPAEAWRLAQWAGAKSLSVGLDVGRWQLLEASFVRRPRVANARVFGAQARGDQSERGAGMVAFEAQDWARSGEETMSGVRQLAEGLIGYLRNWTQDEATATFAEERAALRQERERMLTDRAEQCLMEWKRAGRIRATAEAERLARTLLMHGETLFVAFDGESVTVGRLFAAFVEANSPVVAMGEMLRSDASRLQGVGSAEAAQNRLTALAQQKAQAEGLSYVQAFTAVASERPELALAARGE